MYNLFSKNLSNISITCLTTLTIFAGHTAQANAATITFDADKFSGSPPNTCTPQLSGPTSQCIVQENVNVEAFSAQEIGSESSFFSDTAHFHASNSYEAQHFVDENGLLGVYLTLTNGGKFNLESLDYQLRDIERGVISGFPSDDIKLLIATEFDPAQPVSSQFTQFSIGNTFPDSFQTLDLEDGDFQNISQVFISSSAGVNLDNINITSVPEPTTIFSLFAFLLGSFYLKKSPQEKSAIN